LRCGVVVLLVSIVLGLSGGELARSGMWRGHGAWRDSGTAQALFRFGFGHSHRRLSFAVLFLSCNSQAKTENGTTPRRRDERKARRRIASGLTRSNTPRCSWRRYRGGNQAWPAKGLSGGLDPCLRRFDVGEAEPAWTLSMCSIAGTRRDILLSIVVRGSA
jgi:hypothetical protein